MKIGRLLILLGAAGAGSMVYKARTFISEPGTASMPGQELYSSLTGPGSLANAWEESTKAREAALNGETPPTSTQQTSPVPQPYSTKPSFALGKDDDEDARYNDLELIQASAQGDMAKVERKIAEKVRLDSRDSLRRTPLMYASWNGNTKIASRLIAAGANPQLQDRSGNNSYDYAAGRGLVEEVKYLLNRTRAEDDKNYLEYAQLIRATFASDVTQLPGQANQRLASVNRINPEGQAPIHIAAGNGATKMIKALVERGADVNLANSNRQTPLHWAAWNNKTDALKVLIHYGGDVRQQDLAGNTPLIFAAQSGAADAVILLLKNGADRYISNKEGKTAAIVAEDSGFRDLANLLQ